ncbi:hypothetical protein CANMA_001279 [Candida margitis]|uniref:uncharacterized protein n=1 Tax=Candida margitis TaxID=1775924 RepID=UPI0022266741|nr:uncharacterized protein CANMA_001279 [Candida margitis]KAI5969616.1 hypothetical protein CANMA_001279 [Candida margitis]
MSQNRKQLLHNLNQSVSNPSQSSPQLPLPLHTQQQNQAESQQDGRHPPDEQIDYFHPEAGGDNMMPTTPAYHQSPEQESPSIISTTGKQRLPRKYFCKTCNQGFTRKHNMVSHELIHSSLKPHVCNICHLKFRRIHDLKRHEKLHTGEKPYSCEKCSRRFARPDALTRHQNSANACTGSSNSNSRVNSNPSMFDDGEPHSATMYSQEVSHHPVPLNHLHSGNSIESGDDTPQRPALAVNQHDERDSSATSNSTGVSSNFSSNSNEPATSGDSTTTNNPNCIPTMKTIGLSQEDLERRQNIRSHSDQEFGSKHQSLIQQQQRSQSLDHKAYSSFNAHIPTTSSRASNGPTFTPNPIYPITYYPFPQFNSHNNQISLPPLSVPHQPQPHNSFVPQMTPHHPHSSTNQPKGPLPGISGGMGAIGEDPRPIQRSDSTSVSTLTSSQSSPGLSGLNPIQTPIKFPPNPSSISRSNSIANSFMIPSLGSRPQSLPANMGHQTYPQPYTGQNLTPNAAGTNSSQSVNAAWSGTQNRGSLISSLPPPSQLLKNHSGPNSITTQTVQVTKIQESPELKNTTSSTATESTSGDYLKPNPREQ